MKTENQKSLSSLIFLPLLSIIFIRPFISGLAYPALEFYYEICILSLALITILFERSSEPTTGAQSRTITYAIPIFILISAYTISTITSINPQNSLRECLKFLSYISVFFIVSQASDNQKKLLIKTMVMCAVIISIYSIYQYFWGYQHTIDYLKRTQSDFLLSSSYAKNILIAKRAIGTFPSPNILGSYLLINFFLSLSILFERSSGPLNTVRAEFRTCYGSTVENHFNHFSTALPAWVLNSARRILPAIIIAMALVLTKSLGTWLGLITGLIILFFLSYTSVKHKKVILIVSVISIFIILSFIIITRWERLINIQNPQNSITQRLTYWRVASTIIKNHPLVGVGPGNFQNVFLKYKLAPGTNTRYAHNIFLHQWSETGILGFIGIILLIITFFRRAHQKSRYVFLAGLAFLIHNLIDNSYFIPEAGLFWWVLCGLP